MSKAQATELPLAESRELAPAVNAPIALTDTTALLGMIERLATNPSANVENVERLMALYERAKAQAAKSAYVSSLVAMKPKLPIIDRRGRIVIHDKVDKNKVNQSTPYALWEDIDEAITPILADHGFALTFRSGVAQDGKITVTGVLSHRDGHSEETTITLPHDSTGSKNQVQAVGSSTSYGKRYTATLLLNIRTKGEDDDGKAAGALDAINTEQLEQLQALIVDIGADIPRFCRYFKIEKVQELQSQDFPRAIKMLESKREGKAATQ